MGNLKFVTELRVRVRALGRQDSLADSPALAWAAGQDRTEYEGNS